MKLVFVLAAALFLMLPGASAQAAPGIPCVTVAQNCGPPTGWFDDLAGGTVSTASYTTYTVNFTGTLTTTYLSFALRGDDKFLSLANVSLVDTTTSSSNLLQNGDFSAGGAGQVGNNTPTHWTYIQPPYDVTNGGLIGGEVDNVCGGPSFCYSDGANQGYDGITQPVSTTIGNSYTLSFKLEASAAPSGRTTFSQLSTNGVVSGFGGNGMDLLAYEGPLPPSFTPVPEPATVGLMAAGLIGLAAGRRRRRG